MDDQGIMLRPAFGFIDRANRGFVQGIRRQTVNSFRGKRGHAASAEQAHSLGGGSLKERGGFDAEDGCLHRGRFAGEGRAGEVFPKEGVAGTGNGEEK